MNSILPVCYFPTKKLFVDDDVNFIQSILLQKQNSKCSTINCPDKALNYLLNEYQSGMTTAQLFKVDDNLVDADNQRLVSVDVNKIQDFVANNKNNEIGVIFVDYQMPAMSGVEFLRKIKHLPMKKVLFTGYEDYQVGIQAFNEGLIDGYIRKGDIQFLTLLNSMEAEHEWKFFEDFSTKIAMTEEFSYLNAADVSAHFNALIAKGDVKEFCLSNVQGDFKITTASNEQQHLIIRHKSQLAELASLAEEDGAPAEVVEQLQSAKAIPYFHGKNDWETPGSEWGNYLHTLNALGKGDEYFYALINNGICT